MTYPQELNDQQRRVLTIADALAQHFALRAERYDRDGTFPHENYAELHEAGYLRLVVPREYGGEGADLPTMVLAQERLGHGDGATAMATGMLVQLIGRLAEERTWPEHVFAEVCRTLVTEGGLINTIVTEADLGSISRGGVPTTSATPTTGGWRINGHKLFASGGPALRFLVTGVMLPASDDAPQGETASAIVRAPTQGLRMVDTWHDSLSVRTAGNYDVYYDDVFVPDDWLVGRRPIGAPLAPHQQPGLNAWGLVIAAGYLGVGQAAVDAACDYANGRVPSSLGKPIAELPHIQQQIGQMQVGLHAARAVLYDAARAWTEQPMLRSYMGATVASAKYLCTNAACSATETALRVAGGFSLTRQLPLERFFRDTRAGLFHPPQDDLALAQIGRAALTSRCL